MRLTEKKRDDPGRGTTCRKERIWGRFGTMLCGVALTLNLWCWLRDLDAFIAVYLLATGLFCRWASERAGREADAQRVIAWAENIDQKQADPEGTHACNP